MIIRPFLGVQTIGAASQPVFGTTLSAASTLVTDQFANQYLSQASSANPSVSKVTLGSVSGFKTGDRVLIAPKASFVDGGTRDGGTILSIDTVHNTMVVQGLLTVHANGDYIVINNDAAQVWVIPVALTGVAYLGVFETVASNDPSVFDRLPIYNGTGVPYVHRDVSGSAFSPFSLSEYWIQGTNTDTFIAGWAEFGTGAFV